MVVGESCDVCLLRIEAMMRWRPEGRSERRDLKYVQEALLRNTNALKAMRSTEARVDRNEKKAVCARSSASVVSGNKAKLTKQS